MTFLDGLNSLIEILFLFLVLANVLSLILMFFLLLTMKRVGEEIAQIASTYLSQNPPGTQKSIDSSFAQMESHLLRAGIHTQNANIEAHADEATITSNSDSANVTINAENADVEIKPKESD